jgi:hypothetical protein
MAGTIHTLDAKTRRELSEMLADWRHSRTLTTGKVSDGIGSGGKQIRFARTTTNDANPTYPTPPANKFVVEFGQYEFTDEAGQETVTFAAYDPQVTRVALSRVGYLPTGTEVQVVLSHGRWNILDERWLIRKATANAGITAGSSGTVTVYHAGASTSFTVTAHLNWMHNARNVASADELLIRWFEDESKWVIIEAECT